MAALCELRTGGHPDLAEAAEQILDAMDRQLEEFHRHRALILDVIMSIMRGELASPDPIPEVLKLEPRRGNDTRPLDLLPLARAHAKLAWRRKLPGPDAR